MEDSNKAVYDFDEAASVAYLNGQEPLDSIFVQLEKDEKEWIETCEKDSSEEYFDTDQCLNLFWDGGKGDEARHKIESQYLSRLGKEIAEQTNAELVDVGSDIDVMQLFMTFNSPTPFDFDIANRLVSAWANNTRLVFVDKVEWDWDQKDDKVELCLWIPWRKE